MSPRYGYFNDHNDHVRYGIQATDEGVLTLYDHPPLRWNSTLWKDGSWTTEKRGFDRVLNYPPLMAYFIWASGWLFQWISTERLINTFASRLCFGVWGLVGDFLLAWSCAHLVSRFKTQTYARITYALVLFLPPFWWDSVFWSQNDTMIAALGIAMLGALMQSRWCFAGILLGIATAIKPQAALFLPLWVLAIVQSRQRWRVLGSFLGAIAIFLLFSLPFLLHSGWRWWELSYWNNLVAAFPSTTLLAFNLWYVDLLICDNDEAMKTIAGVSKDLWGKVVLGIFLIAGFVATVRVWRKNRVGLLWWSVWVLLGCLLLPTRVHERYILLLIPFLTVAAMLWKHLWPGWLLLTIVATAQLSWPLWMAQTPGGWFRFEKQILQQAQDPSFPQPIANKPLPQEVVRQLEEIRTKYRPTYLDKRSKTILYEWILTIAALIGALSIAAAGFSPGVTRRTLSDTRVS